MEPDVLLNVRKQVMKRTGIFFVQLEYIFPRFQVNVIRKPVAGEFYVQLKISALCSR
jgi:hypothetical protein